jgi:hypothetical protein
MEKQMDITNDQELWIEATQHQAFTDLVSPVVETLSRSLYEQIAKIVGFDNLIGGEENETETENALNELVAKVLFESLTRKQLLELLTSHKTD